MILIADSGGTSTEWALLNNGDTQFYCSSGLPPHAVDAGVELPPFLKNVASKISRVYFYGAGCATLPKAQILKNLLLSWFENADVEVFSDLLALAHIGYGVGAGYVGILGTGASLAFYNGFDLVFDVPSHGVKHDPGSGSDLSATMHAAFVNGELPTDLHAAFISFCGNQAESNSVDVHKIMHFLRENISNAFVKDVFLKRFSVFFDYYIPVKRIENIPIVFGGSVAALFSDLLHQVAAERNVQILSIHRKPIQHLVGLDRFKI